MLYFDFTGYHGIGIIGQNSNKSPFPRSTLSLNSKCQTQQLAPLSLNYSWHLYHCLIWLQCQWAAWHVTTHRVVLETAFHHSISAAVPPDEATFDSHLTPVLRSNSSAPEFALISLQSHILPRVEHKIWTQSILTSAATTRGLNWCKMIRITDLGRQNISETKWLKKSYQVHQKGRSDKGTGEKTL